MPARDRSWAAEAVERRLLLLGGHFGGVMGIKAEEYDFVVAARVEGKHAQGAHDAPLNFVAQHRAAVVNECEDYGPLAEELPKRNVAAGFIAKMQVERHLTVERRLEPYILQNRRHGRRRRADVVGSHLRLQ